MGGECREDRKYCFNSLLRAAKLDPSNGQVKPGPTMRVVFLLFLLWLCEAGTGADMIVCCGVRGAGLSPGRITSRSLVEFLWLPPTVTNM